MGHQCTLIYQGQRFELAEELGDDAYCVTQWFQQEIAQLEFSRAVHIDETAHRLPAGRIPSVETPSGYELASKDTDGMYRWFPYDASPGDLFENFIRVPLADSNTLFVWGSDGIEFAIEGPTPQ